MAIKICRSYPRQFDRLTILGVHEEASSVGRIAEFQSEDKKKDRTVSGPVLYLFLCNYKLSLIFPSSSGNTGKADQACADEQHGGRFRDVTRSTHTIITDDPRFLIIHRSSQF